MSVSRRRVISWTAGGVVGTVLSTPAFAQTQIFPSKPLRLVVGFAPGGSHDIVARLLSQHMGSRIGQPVVVENRVGAAGTIGALNVIRSEPDGYSILVGSVSNMVISPVTMEKMPFDPETDFAPIVAPTTTPLVMIVKADAPFRTVAELLAVARARPGELTYASAGLGTSNHLGGELLKRLAGVNLTHVPYKGDAPGVLSVMGGETNMMLSTLPPALPHVQSGRLKVLGVATAQRLRSLPDYPTIAEAGVPGFEVNVWNGVVAPARTPNAVVNRLRTEILAVIDLPEVAERLRTLGFERIENTPAEFHSLIRADVKKWRDLAISLGLVKPKSGN